MGAPSRRLAALGAAVWLSGCATPPAPAPQAEVHAPPAPPEVVAPAPPPTAVKRRLRLRPMKIRPLDVKAECSFTDEVGYSASTKLDISYAEVRAFDATVNVPRRGSCHFDLAGFRQVKREPHVELQAADGCIIRLWEQDSEVTVAFSNCAGRCTSRGTFDYVWPILLDRSNGRCK